MLLLIKEDELISMKLTDVEYIRMNKQKDALEVSVIHNENFKKFYLIHKDEIVLNYIKDAYEEYFKIAKRMEIFPEENIEIDSNKNIFDL